MNMYEVMQLIGGMILSVGAIPQIEQIIRTKSVKDLNLTSVITLITGMILMNVYAIHTGLIVFIITNNISLMLAITKLVLIVHFRKKGE